MRVFPILIASSVLVACAPENARPTAEPNAALEILEGAARATGASGYGEPLQLFARATVMGAADTFQTLIHSSSDGRVRMEQTPIGFLAGRGRVEGWLVDAENEAVGELGPAATYVLGHELHMLALRPRSRLSGPRLSRFYPDDPPESLGVTLSLPGGDSVVAYFSAIDTLPTGLRITYTDPHVIVHWSDWTRQAGLRVFNRATFTQGNEVFRYRYDDVVVGPLPDSLFEAPSIAPG